MQNRFFTYDEARASAPGEPLAQLTDWATAYPMNPHPDLGRAGMVCPFLKKSARFDILRLGICEAGPADEDAAFAAIRSGFAKMEKIDAPPGQERLRATMIGYPNCASPEGIEMLERVYKRHKYYTLFRFQMIAFFHPEANIKGLWNKDFLSMRSPMPVLGTRFMIEQDAVFAAKHRLMLGPYLLRFGPAGVRRLNAYRQTKAAPKDTVDA